MFNALEDLPFFFFFFFLSSRLVLFQNFFIYVSSGKAEWKYRRSHIDRQGSCDFSKRSQINGKMSDKAYDEVSIVFD